MFSMTEWTLEGNIVCVSERKNGYWIIVKGIARNQSVFDSDSYEIDCWLSKKISEHKPGNWIKATGRFVFKKDKTFFVADNLLNSRSVNEKRAV